MTAMLIVSMICLSAVIFLVCFFIALCRETRLCSRYRLKKIEPSPDEPPAFRLYEHKRSVQHEPAQRDRFVARRRAYRSRGSHGCLCGSRSHIPQSVRAFRAHAISSSALVCTLIFVSLPWPVMAQSDGETAENQSEELKELRQVVRDLQERVAHLETQSQKIPESQQQKEPAAEAALSKPGDTGSQPLTQKERAVDFWQGTTLNVTFDGYYGYNFNQPVGRVNLLRAYDVTANNFSINQAAAVLERAPDPANGRRFGVRVDLQYGQATETLGGNSANELRPQVYRNLFQAYGTYVVPVGSGLTVDFGKWASALGPEGNYTKDQINYSRSYLFDFLPFYHMGLRAAYNVTPKLTVAYWLVNGANQTEDFNGFKSQNFEFVVKPRTSLTWTSNYYFGQEGRGLVPVLNPGIPSLPTQPGLPLQNLSPEPNGREHIFDSYVFWNANEKLTLGGEFDYVINRRFTNSAPGHVRGGAAYGRYQLTSKTALATRAEYLSDRGGLFSGVTQALKETTLTYEYKIADGLIIRMEWRRDFSNQPFFLTENSGLLKKEQNTATLGLIWWWGRKQGPW